MVLREQRGNAGSFPRYANLYFYLLNRAALRLDRFIPSELELIFQEQLTIFTAFLVSLTCIFLFVFLTGN